PPPPRSATLAAHSPLRSATTTPRAPSAANRSARARPMPLAPPVTTTDLPLSFIWPPASGQLGPGPLQHHRDLHGRAVRVDAGLGPLAIVFDDQGHHSSH